MTVVLVTDTTADIPPGSAPEVHVVPARIAFSDRNFTDSELSPAELYDRLRATREVALPSAPSEDDYYEAFTKALDSGAGVLAAVTPFDIVPSFTNANAAAVALRQRGVKLVNPGVASAGLGALLLSLAAAARDATDAAVLVDRLDELARGADTMFVPGDLDWLERAGRLQAVEDRLGELEATAVVRAGTRISGVAAASSPEQAYELLVENVGKRAGGRPVVAVVDHAENPDAAAAVADLVRTRLKLAQLVVTELSPTFGSQLGPGAVGVGVAPAVDG